jgi:hypothetical protein
MSQLRAEKWRSIRVNVCNHPWTGAKEEVVVAVADGVRAVTTN